MAQGVGSVAELLSTVSLPDGAGVEAEGAAAEQGDSKPGEKPAEQKATGAAWGRVNSCSAGAQRHPVSTTPAPPLP